MQNLILYRQGEFSYIRWIKKRIANNLNFICLFQGPTGIGKTWAAISMAYLIDSEFRHDQIVFDFKELMDVINSDWFRKKKIKILVFDEPQITISNRSWQSTANKMMNYLLSTFRHQNIILVFCSPYSDFLDSQSMKLLHCIFECEGVNAKTNLSRVRPKLQQYNSYKKKTYQHALYVIKSKKVIPLREWWIPKPPQYLIESYEKKKTEFTSKLNLEIRRKLEELSEPKKKDIDTRKDLTPIQKQILIDVSRSPTIKSVAQRYGVNISTISRHVRAARMKGYRPAEFKDAEQEA